MQKLFNKLPAEWTPEETKAVVDVYKTLVDMADKVSQRLQTANGFFLSVNSALIGASAYLSSTVAPSQERVLAIALVGILMSALWVRSISSFKDLNAGKFAVITEIERSLPIAPFTAEWEYLQRGTDRTKYRQFHSIERWVPYIMLVVHAMQFLVNMPWGKVVG